MSLRVHLLEDEDEELIVRLGPLLDSSIEFTHGTCTQPGSDFEILITGTPEAIHQANALFRWTSKPWCQEIF